MRIVAFCLVAVSVLLQLGAARGQDEFDPLTPPADFGGGIVGQFDGSAGQFAAAPVTVNTQILAAQADRPAVLAITARVAPGKHIYSLAQPPGGPNPTRIELALSTDYRLLAPLRSRPAPVSHVETGPVWTGLEIQEHEGQVTWYAPLELTAGVDPKTVEIHGTVRAEACETGGSCEPVQEEFAARIVQDSGLLLPTIDYPGQSALRTARSASDGTYQVQGSVVKIAGRIEPATVRPGETAKLLITLTPPPEWHVYAHALRDNKPGSKPTLIALANTGGLIPQAPVTDATVKTDNSIPLFGEMRYHEGATTWTTTLQVPANTPGGKYRIGGILGYQACQSSADGRGTCELSHAVRFAGTVQVDSETAEGSTPLSFAPADNFKEAATLAAVFADFLDGKSPTSSVTRSTVAQPSTDDQAIAAETQRAQSPVIRSSDSYDLDRVRVEATTGSLSYYIALAFVGGLILNLMPCVLPVIGLKVMSFVEQAGHSRAHALVLNLWYAAGIIAVFLLLAFLACLPQFGLSETGLVWGSQFGNTPFNVTIAAVVFAMALSLLGVWEVPIPGFFGSGSVQSAAAKEGPLGAFLKGIVTTVLATPCTAPIMATAIAWAVAQPVAKTFAVFGALGVGMASPYVVVGVFPELLRFLPKPGRWMETFKQVTGFILLATVVFILSFMEPAAVVPTVALLMGVGVACWLISRTPLTAELRDRLQAWAFAGAVLVAFVAVSFGWLYRDVMQPRFAGFEMARANAAADGAWQPFSLERLKELAVDGGRTVLVDFSADWCINCKVLEKAVLHTEDVEKAIATSGVTTMYADYTDYPEEITRTIQALRANGVPVIAVFPGDNPYEPIVFRGNYTKQGLVEALEKATGRRLGGESGAIAAAAP